MCGDSGVVAIDTNVLVRFLVGDQPAQAKASEKLFASADIFIPDTVLLETEWVLRAAYDLGPADVCATFRQVCGLSNVKVGDAHLVAQVIDWHEAGLDFSDAFHLALSKDQESLRTFDAGFIRNARRHTDRIVERP
jgi:predicted nucleic-acid-binding protein